MIITEKSFILIEEPTGTFVVNTRLEQLLRKEMRPILWFRKGLSCVVPVEVLMNLLNTLDAVPYVKDEQKQINWKQCWPIIIIERMR